MKLCRQEKSICVRLHHRDLTTKPEFQFKKVEANQYANPQFPLSGWLNYIWWHLAKVKSKISKPRLLLGDIYTCFKQSASCPCATTVCVAVPGSATMYP